jgi:hypothetical protein
MSPAVALFTFALGSAALALWTYVRFPRFAPTKLSHAIPHVAAAMLAAQLVTNLNLRLDAGLSGDAAALVHLFGLLLPILVYSFLSALWAFALLTSVFRAYGR